MGQRFGKATCCWKHGRWGRGQWEARSYETKGSTSGEVGCSGACHGSLQLNDLRKPLPQGVAGHTHTQSVLGSSQSCYQIILWPLEQDQGKKSFSYLLGKLVVSNFLCKYHCSKQNPQITRWALPEPSASSSVLWLWPWTPTFPREQIPEPKEGGETLGTSPRNWPQMRLGSCLLPVSAEPRYLQSLEDRIK